MGRRGFLQSKTAHTPCAHTSGLLPFLKRIHHLEQGPGVQLPEMKAAITPRQNNWARKLVRHLSNSCSEKDIFGREGESPVCDYHLGNFRFGTSGGRMSHYIYRNVVSYLRKKTAGESGVAYRASPLHGSLVSTAEQLHTRT